MTIHTFSSREFTRDVSSAKRATSDGPVFITDRGKPAFALLKIEDYLKITGQSDVTLLSVMHSISNFQGIAFKAPKLKLKLRATDLS